MTRPHPGFHGVWSDYLQFALDIDRLPEAVDYGVSQLRRYDFDAIAFSGMSGALLAPPIALRMRKHLIMVRKESDRLASASRHHVEGFVDASRYVIVDDNVVTGMTVRTIVARVKEFSPGAQYIGTMRIASRLGRLTHLPGGSTDPTPDPDAPPVNPKDPNACGPSRWPPTIYTIDCSAKNRTPRPIEGGDG